MPGARHFKNFKRCRLFPNLETFSSLALSLSAGARRDIDAS